MATTADTKPRIPYSKSLAPNVYEKLLSAGAIILLGCVVVAILKGRAEWASIPLLVWPHLLTIVVAVALTPVMLLRPRGTTAHRQLGWVWVSAMFLTAFLSLFLRTASNGSFSVIHILSVYTMIQVPIIVWSARKHNLKRHRYGVRAMVTGALLIAGFFTFPFNRLLGHWLFATTSWG